MTQVTPDSVREYFEQATKAYGSAWQAQASYFDGLVRRNTKALVDLADARIAAFNEMREAKTFNQAFEANIAFEEKVREELASLHEENTKAWEKLDQEVRSIYTPAEEAANSPAGKKTAKSKTAAENAA